MTLKQASLKQWTKTAENKLPPWHAGLRVINQQLWCCCSDIGIVVFDTELQHQRVSPAFDIRWVQDVTEMSNGDVVIAALTGLYHICDGLCL